MSTTRIVAGIDLGGTAINYTFLDASGNFLIEGLCEHPARVTDGPAICLTQIADGLVMAAGRAGIAVNQIDAAGLATPGPASPTGVLSAKGSTNFQHPEWARFDLRGGVADAVRLPVTYFNDGNAAALWGHAALLGRERGRTSVTAVIGTGLGGGIVIDEQVVTGSRGFGGELGHVLVPFARIEALAGSHPLCNCGRVGDLESICSLTAIHRLLLPHLLPRYPGHELSRQPDLKRAAKLVRGYAEAGDALGRDIFRIQAQALGLFFDQMINIFDPDALIVGGGAIEASVEFREWFVEEIRRALPAQREEQAGIPILLMPNGDTAGARGAAIGAWASAAGH